MLTVLLAYAALWCILLTFLAAANVPELRIRLRPGGRWRVSR